jgi:hypothetical protein
VQNTPTANKGGTWIFVEAPAFEPIRERHIDDDQY